MNEFRKGINQAEQILIAGYFVQQNSEAKAFVTKEANDLLKEQGIKIANASQAVADNRNAKNLFAAQKGKYRVSQTGIESIKSLRNN